MQTAAGPSGRDLLAPEVRAADGQRPSFGRVLTKVCWGVALLSAGAGGVFGVMGIQAANGAPQEAAAAAIGCLIVIAPYAFARAVDELTR